MIRFRQSYLNLYGVLLIVLKANHKILLTLTLYLINNFSPLLSNTNQIIITSISSDDLLLHSPIKFTSSGINCFLKHTYNSPTYASEIIPHNTGHLIQMLEHGKKSNQDHDYMIAVLRLFRQKISSAEYISATEVKRITALAPTVFSNHLSRKRARLNKSGTRRLKSLIIRLVENCLNKTLWDSENPKLIQTQFIDIGNNLERMHSAGIIEDKDDLNDMVHMLIDRFIYFIKLIGSDLPKSFYADLKKQLNSDVSWLKIEEIEDLVDSKLQKLNSALFKGRIKSHASKSFGIL
jgi:hypothetical protein